MNASPSGERLLREMIDRNLVSRTAGAFLLSLTPQVLVALSRSDFWGLIEWLLLAKAETLPPSLSEKFQGTKSSMQVPQSPITLQDTDLEACSHELLAVLSAIFDLSGATPAFDALLRSRINPDGLSNEELSYRIARNHLGLMGYNNADLDCYDRANDAWHHFYRSGLGRRNYDPRQSFWGYFYTILKNIIMEEARANPRRQELSLDQIIEQPFSTDNDCHHSHTEILMAAIHSLPHRYRRGLLLRHYDGKSIHALCKELGLSKTQVYNLLGKALLALKEKIHHATRD
jgi:RNA polymerase sigma factor (sigma-70 family)